MAEAVSIIGKDVTIKGRLTGDEDLILAGRLDGHVSLGRHLVVEETGAVLDGVEAEDLTLRGRVQGAVQVTRSVVIEAGAVLVGDITTPRLAIAEGARVQGQVTMDVELPSDLVRRAAPRSGRSRG